MQQWKLSCPRIRTQVQKTSVRGSIPISLLTKLAIMKPLGVKWIMSPYDYIRSQSGIIHGGALLRLE